VTEEYKLGILLGSGSYSTVKLASFRDNPTVHVAVKEMPKQLNNQVLRTGIIHEMDVLNRLDYPGVIKYIDSFETAEVINGVLEFNPGRPLNDVLERMASGYSEPKLSIMYLLAKSVAYLKTKSIVHRDLKPSNVMVVEDQSLLFGFSVQLIDFGFAKSDDKDSNI